jgi:hypothetical protein
MKLLEKIFHPPDEKITRVLLASATPSPEVVERLSSFPDLEWREAFTTRGLLSSLAGVSLVILDPLIPLEDVPGELVKNTLDQCATPVVSPADFLDEPEEWLGRARLATAGKVSFLPAKQVNLVNWSGGVGKTTLAMAICKRFVDQTGLPAAMLELSMGGSALHARISEDLPEFFQVATGMSEAANWHGVSLYPMDGRTIEVLLNEDIGRVWETLNKIRKGHTLFVVDAFPGHPLYRELSEPIPDLLSLVITSPRDDALLQARRLMKETSSEKKLILNMARRLAERTEAGVDVVLPYNEGWVASMDPHLADPLLGLVYPGWKARNR